MERQLADRALGRGQEGRPQRGHQGACEQGTGPHARAMVQPGLHRGQRPGADHLLLGHGLRRGGRLRCGRPLPRSRRMGRRRGSADRRILRRRRQRHPADQRGRLQARLRRRAALRVLPRRTPPADRRCVRGRHLVRVHRRPPAPPGGRQRAECEPAACFARHQLRRRLQRALGAGHARCCDVDDHREAGGGTRREVSAAPARRRRSGRPGPPSMP